MCFFASCDCNQIVTGTVLDGETSKPLANITVYNKHKNWSKTTTDLSGHFKLSNVSGCSSCPPMIVIISSSNFEKVEVSIDAGGHKQIRLNRINSSSNNYQWFDRDYEFSKDHKPFILTGYFNQDPILDTAVIARHKVTSRDALFIKHGASATTYLLKSGKDLGTDFSDFNWVGQFEPIKKGTIIWDNVIEGEIVVEDQVPSNRKITLRTDAIFVHVDEANGGGIIYFKNGKYVWVQQD
jgi:hypothetical protein